MPTQFFYLTSGRDVLATPGLHDPNVAYDNIVFGNGGGDALTGGTGNDWFWGGPNDYGLAVWDTFIGGAGNDVMVSWAQNSYFQGDAGDDIIIYAGPAATNYQYITANGGVGDDQIWALGGGRLYGDQGDDLIVGGHYIDGGPGDDLLIVTTDGTFAFGGDGADAMWAGMASDLSLDGGKGADLLVGDGRGGSLRAGGDNDQDTLIGGAGPDHFVQNGTGHAVAGLLQEGPERFPDPSIVDTIWNFEIGVDSLDHEYSWRSWFALSHGAYSTHTGYAPELGLSGTLVRLDSHRDDGYYFHIDIVFLAGVTATPADLGLRWPYAELLI